MKIVDQFSDAAFGVLTRQLKAMPQLEEFVKEASIDAEELTHLPATAFAWPEERKFPIHNEKQAALSYAYAQAGTTPSSVLERIKEALDVYGVPMEVFTTTKVASTEEVPYLLPDLKLLPVKTAADVTRSEQALHSQLSKLDLSHRALAFGNLVKRADELGVKLHPGSLKLAGLVVSSVQQTRQWLEARALATGDETYKVAYQTLADELARHAEESADRPALLKLASVIDELDQKAGLVKHYDRKLPDPLQTVFNTEKEASEMIDLGGKLVSLSKLASLPASFWTDLGGSELSDEIAPGGVVDSAKLAEVVETLPLDLKVILKSQLR